MHTGVDGTTTPKWALIWLFVGPLRNTHISLFECFSDACPEHVLVK